MARESRKSEFRKGFVKGMQAAFSRSIYLPTLQSVEANQIIAIRSSERYNKAWIECRKYIISLEDAYVSGQNEGEQAWKDDNEMDEVAKMAELSVITK